MVTSSHHSRKLFKKEIEGLNCKINGQALEQTPKHSSVVSSVSGLTVKHKHRAFPSKWQLLLAALYWRCKAVLKLQCCHSTSSVRGSKRFNAWAVNLKTIVFDQCENEIYMDLVRTCYILTQDSSICSIFWSFNGLCIKKSCIQLASSFNLIIHCVTAKFFLKFWTCQNGYCIILDSTDTWTALQHDFSHRKCTIPEQGSWAFGGLGRPAPLQQQQW